MQEQRPDPDALLKAVESSSEQRTRGRLKIFFGAAAGVGKTYAMLAAAQEQLRAGVDVVAGVVETHGRQETEQLLKDLPQLDKATSEYRGIELREFDLDAALKRKPALLLMDELAHSNAPGSRHAKRWQDVDELLNAGIDVYSTLNVQHLESLNDLIAQITGIVVRETLPDAVLDRADEVELVDISPEELLQRLADGKVYIPAQARLALDSFFNKANITALRELALRQTARQVDSQLQTERTLKHQHAVWPAAERIIVCVSPSPLSADLVRAAKRLAAEMHAEWEAVYVETAASSELPAVAQLRLAETLRLAEVLGGTAVTLSGERVAETLIAYAQQRNASKILVGKPTHSPWLDRLRGSMVVALIRLSGDIDVYVVRAPAGKQPGLVAAATLPHLRSGWPEYVIALVAIAITTALGRLAFPTLHPANLVMLYLLAVVLVALRAGRGPAILAAVLAVAAFDYYFVPPQLTFVVQDVEYLITFAILLAVGVIIASLTWRLKQQTHSAISREKRTSMLYRLSREMAVAQNVEQVALSGERLIAEQFQCAVAVVLPQGASGSLVLEPRHAGFCSDAPSGLAVMQWVLSNGKPAGLSTATLPGAEALYLPLSTSRGTMGVLGVRPLAMPAAQLAQPELRHTLETCATLIALALEREQLEHAEQQAVVHAETERLRSALLSSISHDLRTPLAGIRGSVETMLALSAKQPSTERELLEGIRSESERLALLLENILDLTRFTSSSLTLHLEPQPLEEVVGAALHQLEPRLRTRELLIQLPDDLPLVSIDAVLIERVLVNLLDNALKYTPDGSPLELSAVFSDGWVVVNLADRGPGLPTVGGKNLFTAFSQPGDTGGSPHTGGHGTGLGLSISKAIINAHGGRISAAPRPGGGSVFNFSLKAEADEPTSHGVETTAGPEEAGDE